MAAASRSTPALVLAVSMALLTVGLGIDGSMGLLLILAAVVGCVTTLVLARAMRTEQGSDAERETG
jgi:hypothetical protein